MAEMKPRPASIVGYSITPDSVSVSIRTAKVHHFSGEGARAILDAIDDARAAAYAEALEDAAVKVERGAVRVEDLPTIGTGGQGLDAAVANAIRALSNKYGRG